MSKLIRENSYARRQFSKTWRSRLISSALRTKPDFPVKEKGEWGAPLATRRAFLLDRCSSLHIVPAEPDNRVKQLRAGSTASYLNWLQE